MRKDLTLILILLLMSCGSSRKTDPNQTEKKESKYLNPHDFSLQKLSDVDIDKLQLVDSTNEIYIKERQHTYSTMYYHYYTLDTTKDNYNSYVYYYCGDIPQAFVLVNYDKKGKYIDDICISYRAGDGGDFDHSEGVFVNDSIIMSADTTGHCEWIGDSCRIIIDNITKLRMLLKRDGHILIDTIK